ncbi:NADP-dependent 3-hydroxy acid dehydrogenase YdfG [Paraoerskovia marina]|uniref:NADP-dependent 3-hydroxy acid dehydrogenase YdfG n=1 Tax=Paraoerskovia marina TaxID=545619 RepID=A0A1H1SH98_9CELL|nr:SDR family oxidoreductase [Paraoerskovia marina]SDS47096.1 NADP-dependent 3-hydroxy acid dehydrogenase YdfG [Paraoerskovia marina]
MSSEAPAVVVVGATGYVGSRLTRWFLDRGWAVLACGRDAAALARLEEAGAQVVDVRAFDDRSSDQPERAMRELTAQHTLHGVVASVGGWWIGDRLEDLSRDVWDGFLESHLTSHLTSVQHLVPHLPPGAGYVVLNGAASHVPMAGSGPVSVTGAALHMLVEVLRAESTGVRFREVVVERAIAGDDRNRDPEAEVALDSVAEAVRDALDDGPDVRRVDVG